jgi:hypothetical protein
MELQVDALQEAVDYYRTHAMTHTFFDKSQEQLDALIVKAMQADTNASTGDKP